MRRRTPFAVASALAALLFAAPVVAHAAPKVLDCKKVEQKKRKGGRVAQLLAVAKCHHDTGQFTAAWYEYTEAAARARDAKDKKSLAVAQQGERENAGLLAWITVNADKESELDIDGEKTFAGTKKAVDPGPHTITAKSRQRRTPWRKSIALNSGDVEEINVPPPTYEPSTTVETPASPPSSASPAAVAAVASSPATTPDKHEESSSDDDDDDEPHVGFAADLDAFVALYEEPSASSTEGAPPDIRNGQAFAFLGHVAYDFTPSLRAFLRYGFVDNYAPGRAHAAALSNLALGASYGIDVASFVRVTGEGALILPIGSGSGTDPAQGIAIANARARSLPMHPAMFDSNFITPYVGGIASTMHTRIVGRFELFVDPSFKVNDADDEATKIRLRAALHGGYRVLSWLEPFAEARYFRFLSSTRDTKRDSALADNLWAGIGVAATLGPLRAQVVYLRALDAPLKDIDFNVFAIRVGGDL